MSRPDDWAEIERLLRTRWNPPWMIPAVDKLERKVRSWPDLEHLLDAVEDADAKGGRATMNELLVDASGRRHRAARDGPHPARASSTAPNGWERSTGAACRCDGTGWIDTGTAVLFDQEYGPILERCPCLTHTS